MTTNIVIPGAAGRMGRTLIEACCQADGVALSAATERPGSSVMGADAGELAGLGKLGVAIVEDLSAVASDFDVLKSKNRRLLMQPTILQLFLRRI